MITQTYAFPINPKPWKVPPMSVARKGKIQIVVPGKDVEGGAYKDALVQALKAAGADMLKGPYSIQFLFWRRLEQYKTESGRNMTRRAVDATNMLKLAEDALQDVLIDNDKNDRDVRATIMEQSVTAIPCVALIIRAELDEKLITIRNVVDPDVVDVVTNQVNAARVEHGRLTQPAPVQPNFNNKW